MFERAVICTDLTPSSSCLVRCASALGVLGVREVVLTHVIDVFAADTSATGGDIFAEQASSLEKAGLRVHVEMPVGTPSESVHAIADVWGAELIVVGSHGKGMFDEPFSGSISSDLARGSSRPVLVTPFHSMGEDEDCEVHCSHLLHRVLFATDFGEAARHAEHYLLGLVRKGSRSLTLMTARIPPAEAGPAAVNAIGADLQTRERLEALQARITGVFPDAHVEVLVRFGEPAALVSEEAASGAYSLVVMGTQGDGQEGVEAYSVANDVVRLATAPLLLVPPYTVIP